jgi:hypothetical protein
MDGTDIGQISSALGAGPIIPLVNTEGALTASGYFSLWATLYFPNSKNATDRETLATRMMADSPKPARNQYALVLDAPAIGTWSPR